MSDPRHVVHYVAMSDEQVDDRELLRLATRGSREAMAEIARRYVGFVYAAALRQVRDAHLAEDVTQAVFVILAQKVGRIKAGAPLHAWLFTTTRYAAANATKLRNRRQFHERQAAAMREHERESSSASASASASWSASSSSSRIAPVLDEALAQLRESDRSAILLSYMAGKSWREVAGALGTTEEAARKRVGRAVAQLRAFFVRRGVHVSAAAVSAGLTSAARASSAPAGLVESVACCMAAPALSGAAAKGVVSMMMWSKLKAAGAFAAGSLLTIGFAGAMVMRSTAGPDAAPKRAPATAPAAAAAADAPHAAQLKGGITVQLVGVVHYPPKGTSWDATGQPHGERIDLPQISIGEIPEPAVQIVTRVSGIDPAAGGIEWEVLQRAMTTGINPSEYDGGLSAVTIHFTDGRKATDLKVRFATGEWETVAEREGNGLTATNTVIFGEIYDAGDGRCGTTVTDALLDHQVRLVVIDTNGQEHVSGGSMSAKGQGFRQSVFHFPMGVEDVARMEFRARPFDQWVEFKNVALSPNATSDFSIKSSAGP